MSLRRFNALFTKGNRLLRASSMPRARASSLVLLHSVPRPSTFPALQRTFIRPLETSQTSTKPSKLKTRLLQLAASLTAVTGLAWFALLEIIETIIERIDVHAAEPDEPPRLPEIDAGTLTHTSLIRQAILVTIDSVTRVLTQTISNVIEAHDTYRRCLDVLMAATSDSLELIGSNSERENHVWDLLIEARAEAQDKKKALTDVELFYDSVSKLAHTASETAFHAGADLAGTLMGERIHSASMQIQNTQEKTRRKEDSYLEMERRAVEIISKSSETQRAGQ